MTIVAQLLDSIGLISGIGGVLIMFKYGPPQPSFQGEFALLLEDSNVLSNNLTAGENRALVTSRKSRITVTGYQLPK